VEVECIFEARSALSESPLWSPGEQVLYWLDQMRPELHRLEPETGRDEAIQVELPEQLGAIVPHAGGGLVLAASDGISILAPDLKSRKTLANPIAHIPRASFNDAKCDRQGRLWAGTTDRLETQQLGSLYRFAADGTSTIWAKDFVCSNGPSFSPDGKVMYHTQSHERTIYAYDLDPDSGQMLSRRIFATLDSSEGNPDGSTVDAEGYLWSAHWGGSRVTRYSPDGRIDRVVRIPAEKVTSCAFGGEKMDKLFVTTASIDFINGKWMFMEEAGFAQAPLAGAIFALDPGVAGLAEPAFG
jgi:xylono-1,5-lactonase